MLDRNERREIFLNSNPIYESFLKRRGISSFRHYSKMKIGIITPEEITQLTVIDHIWLTGDRLSKLAFKYYGDTRYWWVLAWFNQKPTDNFCKLGDTIHIPLPLEEVLYYLGRDE